MIRRRSAIANTSTDDVDDMGKAGEDDGMEDFESDERSETANAGTDADDMGVDDDHDGAS